MNENIPTTPIELQRGNQTAFIWEITGNLARLLNAYGVINEWYPVSLLYAAGWRVVGGI